MPTSRREFVKWVTASGITLQPVASGRGRRNAGFAARETLPGRQELEPGRHRHRPHRRRRQGHRSQALRLRFSRRRSAGLAGEDLARHAHPRAGRHACLHRHRPRAPERRVEANGGGHRGRSRAHRHPRSRILCRRPVLPGRQDAALSRPARGSADLREVRRFRSGAAGAARRHFREIRRGDRPGRDAGLRRLSLHARGRPDARRARCLLADPGRLGQPRRIPEQRPPDMGAARDRDQGAPTPRPRRTASRSAPSLRANNPALLVLDREFETQSVDPMFLEPECGLAWYNAGRKNLELVLGVQSPYEAAEVASRTCSAKPAAPFKPARINAQFAYIGGGFGGRDHTPFPLYVALAAMFLPGRPVRLAHDRYQQFQAASSGTPSRCARGSASIARPARSSHSPPTTCSDGGGLANFSASVATVARHRCDRHLRHSEGRYHHGRAAFARRDCGVDARLRNAADDDRAGGIDRRSGGGVAARPDRVPATQRAQGRRPDHDRKSVQRLGPHAGDPGQAGEASDLAAARRREGPRHSKRALSSAPASLAPPRITAAARTVRWGRWKSTRRAGLPSTAITSRWATASGPRSPIGWRPIWAVWPTKSRSRNVDAFDALALVTSGDSYTMDQATQDAAQRNPRWVPAISSATTASIGAHVGTHAAAEAARVVFRFGSVAGGARTVAHCADRSKGQAMDEAARWKDGQLDHAGVGAAGVAGGRGKGACAQWRDRGDGAQLFPLGMVAGDLRDRRTAMDGRYRCAGRAQGRRQIRAARSYQRQISAHRVQPVRNQLHVAVRHAGPHRDRARYRRAAHRQGIQRLRMRRGAGAGGRARAGAGRLRDGRRLRAA